MKPLSNASRHTLRRYFYLAALLSSLMLAGCGQKGPLYMPRPVPVPGQQVQPANDAATDVQTTTPPPTSGPLSVR